MNRQRRRFCRSVMALLLAAGAPGLQASVQGEVARRSAALPARPLRVVVLEFTFVEMLLELGITPVGMPEPKHYAQWLGYASEQLVDVVDVGTRQQPNLEAVAMLEPDLIIALDYRHMTLFDTLDSLAPTIMMRYDPGAGGVTQLEHTVGAMQSLSQLVGKMDEAEHQLQQFSAALEEDRQALVGQRGRQVSLMHDLGLGHIFWAYAGNSMAAGIARHHGLVYTPDSRPGDGMQYVRVDELIRQEDLHLLLIAYRQGQDLETTLADPMWQLVPARQSERIALLRPNIWAFGSLSSAIRLSREMRDSLLRMA
ncbi:ABC transporter substrate-binding protein [Marinobacterium lacunae]|nr:iron-siderophore ABC transporter substrate-binding protein [Marinobacterium lacunae]